MGGAMFQRMQQQMLKIQEQLATETVEASAGGGAVKVTMTGQQRVEAVQIQPEAVDPEDVETLQDMVVAAVNEAITKSQELQAKRLGAGLGLPPGLRIPGLG